MTPSEWIEEDIGELFQFHRTTALSRAQLSEEGEIGYIHYGDIHAKWGTHLNVSEHELPRVRAIMTLSATRVQDGDLVLADASEDLEGVGRAVEISGVGDQEIIAGLHTVLMRPRPNTFEPGFAGFLQRCPEFQAQSRTLAAGLKVYGLSKTALRKIRVSVPPVAEQRVIAKALSDANALVVSLDELIAKKRDVKQAATQQLLTGRTRLPGFAQPWSDEPLGSLLQYEQPTKYLVKTSDYLESGNIPVLTAGKSFLLGYTNEEDGIYHTVPTILFDDFTTAAQWVDFPFKVKSSACKMLTTRSESVDLRFVYEQLREIRFEPTDHKRHWISMFASMTIRIPTPEEQRAIAEVLSDMDAEIDALVAQREKADLVKQGMMQELLSGRVRLV